jgi:predicted nucleic acid-binding protein
MTTAKPDDPLPSLVAYAMVIHHFAKADRLDVLGACLTEMSTTHIVAEEVSKYIDQYPSLTSLTELEWLQILPQDTDEELLAFDRWVTLLGAGDHDLGEASVFAAAETHPFIALTDDHDATTAWRFTAPCGC